METQPIGVYIHVPFCKQKCPYCDFYSMPVTDETADRYTEVLCETLAREGERFSGADTLYFGGGTPSLLGAGRLTRLCDAARDAFGLQQAEITLEANPAECGEALFAAFAAAGGNRVSIGVQATENGALRRLGRRHTVEEAQAAVEAAHRAGIGNVSVDLMLGTEGQTEEDVRRAAALFARWGVSHVSAYLLKIEPHTPFGKCPPPLPDEDATATLYLTACEALEQEGFRQYEISNFARDGQVSRHNLKYWNSEPYLGLGPSAHSFYGGKRTAYPRDLRAFLEGGVRLPEADGEDAIPEGSETEYAMLRLRLCEGLRKEAFERRFGRGWPEQWTARARQLPATLVQADSERICLTREGFLVSNALLRAILSI